MTDEMKHEEERALDLRALDPERDEAHFERLIQRVRRAATPELIRRQEGAAAGGALDLWSLIAQWRRGLLVASGALAAASLLVLLLVQPASTTSTTLAESLGVPETVVQWLEAGEQPGPGEFLRAQGSE
jgi:hypothetical protein